MSNFIDCSDGDKTPLRPPTYGTRSNRSEIPSIFHQFLRCSDDKVDVVGLIGRDTSAAPDDDCGLTLVQYGAASSMLLLWHQLLVAKVTMDRHCTSPTLPRSPPS